MEIIDHMNKRRMAAAIFSSTLVLIASSLVYKYINLNYGKIDLNAWMDDMQGNNGQRKIIADRLLAQGRLNGLKNNDVIKLLGKPNGNSHFSDCESAYRLGLERGFISIDSEWLVIKFSNDTVVDARVTTD